MTKKEVYVAKMKTQLDELNADIEKLEEKTKEATDDMREKYIDEMKKLRQQSTMATTKFDELKAAGEESWENMVAEVEKVRDAFTSSFKYFKAQL